MWHKGVDLDLVVVLGDPRLDNPYHRNTAQQAHDLHAVERLRGAMTSIAGEDRVRYLNNHDRLLGDLRRADPDLVLNFCNAGFRNQPELQLHVAALIDMLGLPFAGADAECLAVCHDKAGVNAAARQLGIPVPDQSLLRLGGNDVPQRYPAMLKPNDGSGSIGISTRSIVHDDEQARRQLAALADETSDTQWVTAEEFLDGREVSVAVLGGTQPGDPPYCLPALEVDYRDLPEDLPRIMTQDSKANEESVYWQRLALTPAELTEDVRQNVEEHCVAMFDRLGCRDYARFDFRLDDRGVPRLIDANAHPEWGPGGMVATMAGFAEFSYEDLLTRIAHSALARTSREPRRVQGPSPEPVAEARGVRLRPTTAQDLGFVRDVDSVSENSDYTEQWSAEEHLSAVDVDHTVHLIIEDEHGHRAGYVVLDGLTRPERSVLLRRIVVPPEGQRIGERAMEALERYCFDELAFPRVWLDLPEGNERAVRLCRHHGFVEERRYGAVQMALLDHDVRRQSSELPTSRRGRPSP